MNSRFRNQPGLACTGFALLLGMALLTACGKPAIPALTLSSPSTSASSSPSPSVSVTISPSTATVTQGGSISFVATLTGAANTAVTWSIQEGSTGGSITNSGLYRAPNTSGTYHVVATSVADATVSAVAAVSVVAPTSPPSSSSVSVTISPLAVIVTQGETISFTATVTGTANTAVTWSIREHYGASITSSGVLTAPSNAVGTLHVVATSVADPTVSAAATVSVQPPTGTATGAGVFTAVGNMSTGRVSHTATLLDNGKVLVAGGWDGSHALASAELYDPETRTFAPTGSMITPRQSHTATLLADGRVLIAGGNGDWVLIAGGSTNGPPIFTAEIYDPATGTFTQTGDLNAAGGTLAVDMPGDVTTLLADGRVFVAAVNNAEIYDPHSGAFTLTGPYLDPVPLIADTVTLLGNGKVLFTEWCCNGIGVELFDPQSGTFGVTGLMTAPYSPDYGYTAALLLDGRVFFLGSDEFGGYDVETYDPAAGKFDAIAGAAANQINAPATRLTDGTVLIAGGQVPGGSGSVGANLFVPSSGTFEYAGAMTVARASQKATALPDDTVLITGGWNIWTWPNPQPTSSAEVYKPR